MIKKWLLTVRNFSHVFLKRQHKSEITPYPLFMGLMLCAYYLTIFFVMILIINKTIFNFSLWAKNNALGYIIIAIMMVASFYYFNKWILLWLKPIPLPEELSKREFFWGAVVLVLTFLMGFVFLPLMINAVEYLLSNK